MVIVISTFASLRMQIAKDSKDTSALKIPAKEWYRLKDAKYLYNFCELLLSEIAFDEIKGKKHIIDRICIFHESTEYRIDENELVAYFKELSKKTKEQSTKQKEILELFNNSKIEVINLVLKDRDFHQHDLDEIIYSNRVKSKESGSRLQPILWAQTNMMCDELYKVLSYSNNMGDFVLFNYYHGIIPFAEEKYISDVFKFWEIIRAFNYYKSKDQQTLKKEFDKKNTQLNHKLPNSNILELAMGDTLEKLRNFISGNTHRLFIIKGDHLLNEELKEYILENWTNTSEITPFSDLSANLIGIFDSSNVLYYRGTRAAFNSYKNKAILFLHKEDIKYVHTKYKYSKVIIPKIDYLSEKKYDVFFSLFLKQNVNKKANLRFIKEIYDIFKLSNALEYTNDLSDFVSILEELKDFDADKFNKDYIHEITVFFIYNVASRLKTIESPKSKRGPAIPQGVFYEDDIQNEQQTNSPLKTNLNSNSENGITEYTKSTNQIESYHNAILQVRGGFELYFNGKGPLYIKSYEGIKFIFYMIKNPKTKNATEIKKIVGKKTNEKNRKNLVALRNSVRSAFEYIYNEIEQMENEDDPVKKISKEEIKKLRTIYREFKDYILPQNDSDALVYDYDENEIMLPKEKRLSWDKLDLPF